MTNLLTTAVRTAYCACSACCGPRASGLTASGVRPVEGRTVAANHLPFGTWVRIQGIGLRRVEDRLAKRYTGRFDVYFKSHAAAKRFGLQVRSVTLDREILFAGTASAQDIKSDFRPSRRGTSKKP